MVGFDGGWHAAALGPKRPGIVFVAPDGSLMAVRLDARGSSWRAGSPVRVVEGRYLIGGGRSSPNYDVSRDGTRFLMVKPPVNQAAAPQIIVVQSWLEELKARVPVR
jgi:hypothetical protein